MSEKGHRRALIHWVGANVVGEGADGLRHQEAKIVAQVGADDPQFVRRAEDQHQSADHQRRTRKIAQPSVQPERPRLVPNRPGKAAE